ncbi:MLP-like protein 28 [Herrania umbratica]|uniref:MLP-like protein 28 n=1 Tax=Herrania umbratica TaxID=108875 RepID=A0A6J1B2H5_9ROSI|nr:MLP-like protein 28 [Herrania umbratica]
MAQLVKLEVQLEIQSSAEKVYDIFKRKMYLLPKICPELVTDAKVVKGDWETVGSVRIWKYVAGLSENASETIEAIDDRNKSITFNALDGDITKYYKTFKAIVTVTANGQGSLVKWTLMYEKQNQNIPDPEKYIEFASAVSKSVDAYLLKQ